MQISNLTFGKFIFETENLMKLSHAKIIARNLVEEISPFCEKVMICGSIRREKPEVKDIEIVAIPKFIERETPTDNLFEPVLKENVNWLHFWATVKQKTIRWIKPGTSEIITWTPKADGRYWRGLVKTEGKEIKLDLFLANPDNFGVIETIRTGPADFSQALVTVIKHQTPFRVFEGHLINEEQQIISCPTQEAFFRNAGIVFVPVQIRETPNPYSILHFL